MGGTLRDHVVGTIRTGCFWVPVGALCSWLTEGVLDPTTIAAFAGGAVVWYAVFNPDANTVGGRGGRADDRPSAVDRVRRAKAVDADGRGRGECTHETE